MSRSGNQSAPQCLLTPDEIHKLVPIIQTDKVIVGAAVYSLVIKLR